MITADPLAVASFQRAVERWHEYYLLAGTAAVTLMGLLFVSLSIHIERITHESGRHLEAMAREAFSSFLIVLFVSLIMLIPAVSRRPLATSLIAVGVIRGAQTLRRIRVAMGSRAPGGPRAGFVGFVFPLLGSLLMVGAGVALLRPAIEEGLAMIMISSVFLLADAARSSYELLVGTARRVPGENVGRG